MARLKLKYVDAFVDRHGKAHYYFRRAGQRVRLPGPFGSSEFMFAYGAALAEVTTPREIGVSRTMPGTINALIIAYYRSEDFRSLAAETQQARCAVIEKFRSQNGNNRVAMFERKHVLRMLSKIEKRHAKKNWFKAIRGLMKFAVLIGMRTDDPTAGIRVKVPRSEGHSWTDQEIAQYRAYWPLGTQERLALELAYETTSRRADVTKLGPQHVRGGKLVLKHSKNNVPSLIPISPELRAAIDAVPTTSLTFMHKRNGAPRTPKGLGEDFRKWCDLAGLPKRCTIHGLRRAGATRLADAGATAHEIQSYTGHKTLSEVQRYTQSADRERLAERAAAKLRRTKSGT